MWFSSLIFQVHILLRSVRNVMHNISILIRNFVIQFQNILIMIIRPQLCLKQESKLVFKWKSFNSFSALSDKWRIDSKAFNNNQIFIRNFWSTVNKRNKADLKKMPFASQKKSQVRREKINEAFHKLLRIEREIAHWQKKFYK